MMPGTCLVLVIMLTFQLLYFVAFLVIASRLARHNGQKLGKASWSLTHGFTAEFYSEPQSGNNT